MSLREWLILLGAIIVIGIILDGIRRMHRARKDSLAISRGMGADQLDDSPLDEFNPELPGGGARIIDRLGVSAEDRAAAEDRVLETEEAEYPEEYTETGLSADDLDDRLPEDFSLNADTDPDIADEPVETQTPIEPQIKSPSFGTPRSLRRPVKKPAKKPVRRSNHRGRAESSARDQAGPAPELRDDLPEELREEQTTAASSANARPLAGSNRPPAKEVFVINVDSRNPEGFSGGDLKRLLEACGLEHGDMDIYHRHENDDTRTPVQFSVANAVEPGTFNPPTMDSMSTPAISFFMSLPGPTDSLQAYDFMIETAQAVVRNLGGELKDERRSVMTAQTIEHGRQRVREFERKRRSAKV